LKDNLQKVSFFILIFFRSNFFKFEKSASYGKVVVFIDFFCFGNEKFLF